MTDFQNSFTATKFSVSESTRHISDQILNIAPHCRSTLGRYMSFAPSLNFNFPEVVQKYQWKKIENRLSEDAATLHGHYEKRVGVVDANMTIRQVQSTYLCPSKLNKNCGAQGVCSPRSYLGEFRTKRPHYQVNWPIRLQNGNATLLLAHTWRMSYLC